MFSPLTALTGLSGMAEAGAPAPQVLLLDSFTDADDTVLTSHAMDVGPGWTVGGAVFKVTGNAAQWQEQGAFLTADAGQADVTVTCAISQADGQSGVVVRCSDDVTGWIGVADASNVYLYESDNSGVYLRDSQPLPGDPGAHTITVVCSGTTISVTVNGVTASYGSATANQTVTNHGICNTGQTLTTYDNFQVTT